MSAICLCVFSETQKKSHVSHNIRQNPIQYSGKYTRYDDTQILQRQTHWIWLKTQCHSLNEDSSAGALGDRRAFIYTRI
jgi:hypothetical protein